ncbi:YqjK-like family protein [Vreelandella stevensii]|uniref:YqjK-like family protein n=1 Tax=Vreelandella stevensii TaxID=502821 RepID=UPI0037485F58
MTNSPNAAAKASEKPMSRQQRKAALLAELEQQRIDILVNSDTLQRTAAPLDRHWHTLRVPLYVVGGLAALRLVRHPNGALALGKRALAGYMLFRKLRMLARVTR